MIVMTDQLARAAATDAGNRSMRAAGRTSWNEEDYHAAVTAYNALLFARHMDEDPHCTCNDCMDFYERRQGD